jgi:hypothetical protein
VVGRVGFLGFKKIYGVELNSSRSSFSNVIRISFILILYTPHSGLSVGFKELESGIDQSGVNLVAILVLSVRTAT